MLMRNKPQKKVAGDRPAWGAGAGNPVRREATDFKVEKMNRQIAKLTNLHSIVRARNAVLFLK